MTENNVTGQDTPGPMTIKTLLIDALKHHHAGRLTEAASMYRAILDVQPDHADAMGLLGLLLYQSGNLLPARSLLHNATALHPNLPSLRVTLASVLTALGETAAAAQSLHQALEIDPANLDTIISRAGSLASTQNATAAETWLRRAIALRPDYPAAHNNLGNLLQDRGDLDNAAAHYSAALAAQPNQPEVLYNLGNVLRSRFQNREAADLFRASLALAPAAAQVLNNLGNVLVDSGDLPGALVMLRRAGLIASDDARIRGDLAAALAAVGMLPEARRAFSDAALLDPQDLRARLGECVTGLPVIYQSVAEIAVVRARYVRELMALVADAAIGRIRPDARVIGSIQPFALPYQGEDDCDLQRLYGDMICRIAATAPSPSFSPASPAIISGDHRIRVGFVSGHFRRHTVWNLFGNWLDLDPGRFEVSAYYCGREQDSETRRAQERVEHFVHGSAEMLTARIGADRPDLLIYPEIGMDPVVPRLAARRLAPVQAMAWGHPETSGMPTIDYFLSSYAMEPANGQRYYNESLVRLPRLSIRYQPPTVTPEAFDLAAAGRRSDAVSYLCCQSLFKYLPQYDALLPAIAEKVPAAQFLFLSHHTGDALNTAFQTRLAAAFRSAGQDPARHLVMLPRLSAARYAWLNQQADVFLDSVGWSGGNTTLEAIAYAALPVVTLPGPMMRGRHAAAILAVMDMTETIARDGDHYVALAARLGLDSAFREQIRNQTRERRANLYDDPTVLPALESWIIEACNREK